jgi:hypothetical protein
VVANGPLAVERGSYQLDATPKAGAPKGTLAIHDAGKYLQRWQLVNGRWLLADQEWNSDRPLSMAAAPAKATAKKSGAKAPAKGTKKKR